MRFFLFSLLLMVFSCGPAVVEEVQQKPKDDPLERYRQELRRDYEEFLRKARELRGP